MSYIRHKVIKNKTYAYEITSYWDKQLQCSRSTSKYLGPVDPSTQCVVKFNKKPPGKEKLILDFGDAYFLHHFMMESTIYKTLKIDFFDQCPELIPLMIYRLCTHSAMYNCEEWLSGSVLNFLVKHVNLSSQRISDVFSSLGDESIQRTFFSHYLKLLGGSNQSVIIDATSLPNHINIDFNAWGRADGKIDKQFRLLCVVDQLNQTPLYYRLLPGNITDVSTLQTTILELQAMGVNNSFILIDAGYFSESNISDLFNKKIDFVTRMPAGRKLYQDIILNKINNIENLSNAQILRDRSFFIQRLTIDLYGHQAYAFVIVDPERKAKETKELLQQYCLDQSERDETKDKLAFASCGIMILISTKEIPVAEILSAYYMRQSVEQVFSFSKSDLGLLPIRNHNEKTVRGYLFFQFLLLVFYIKIRERIPPNYTVEQVLLTLRKLKCKVFDKQLIPSELTKKQRVIFEQTKILVPNFLGI